MVKDGVDRHGLQTTKLEILGLTLGVAKGDRALFIRIGVIYTPV